MAVKYLAGDRLIGTAAERTALSGNTPTAIPQTSWKELGRTILTSSGSTCTVTGLASKDNLLILRHTIGGDTAIGSYMRVGNGSIDSGSNYAERSSYSGGSDATAVSQAELKFQHSFGVHTTGFDVTYVRNIATREKLFMNHYVYQRAAGASNAPERGEGVGKWANTSNVIDQVQMLNASGDTGAFQTGTELVVLGCDDDEADSGTSFWQELTNTPTLGTPKNTVTTAAFTAKKYMKFTVHVSSINNTNMANSYLRMGSSGTIDTGANYAWNVQINGGTNGKGVDYSNGIYCHDYSSSNGGDHGGLIYSGFIVNIAGKEKMVIMDAIEGMSSITAPKRQETTGKWANTSAQANILQIYSGGSNDDMLAASFRVWGSD